MYFCLTLHFITLFHNIRNRQSAEFVYLRGFRDPCLYFSDFSDSRQILILVLRACHFHFRAATCLQLSDFTFFRKEGFYTCKKINHMKNPHTCKDHTGNIKLLQIHQEKSQRHQHRNRCHDTDFCTPGHSFSLYITFQIVFVQVCIRKPPMQPVRAPGKSESCQQQKRECRQHGEHSPHHAQCQAQTAQQHPEYSLNSHILSPIDIFLFCFPPHAAEPSPDGRSPFSDPKTASLP